MLTFGNEVWRIGDGGEFELLLRRGDVAGLTALGAAGDTLYVLHLDGGARRGVDPCPRPVRQAAIEAELDQIMTRAHIWRLWLGPVRVAWPVGPQGLFKLFVSFTCSSGSVAER